MTSFILENVDLRKHTYYQMGGMARYFAVPSSFSEVAETIVFARDNKLPIAVLGTGSNSVFADGLFEGVVVTLSELRAWHWEQDDILYAEAGVTNTEIAELCLADGVAGASWMFRMPGQLGATVRMNARCYEGEISQIVKEVLTIDIDGHLHTREGDQLFRGYKDTLLMHEPEIVLAVRFQLPSKAAPTSLLTHMLQCEADRHSKHHFDNPSCGSTFKNNYQVGRPSGKVFDALGLKGEKRGQAEVSQFHANFVWNLGNATTRDMLELTAHMRSRALNEANANLELEVQPIGSFDKDLFRRCGMEKLGKHYKADSEQTWVGLLWHPSDKQKSTQFPLTLFQLPFQEYFRTPYRGVRSIHTKLEQLCSVSDAEKNPDQAFLKWTCFVGDDSLANFHLSPSLPPGTFVDELWHSSVAEIFFSACDGNGPYFEFEMTPKTHWVALKFEAPRKRYSGFEVADEKHWVSGVKRFVETENSVFGMTFTFALLRHVIKDRMLSAQSMLSLGSAHYLLAPHWKKKNIEDETWDYRSVKPIASPNFHQPERFWTLRLH